MGKKSGCFDSIKRKLLGSGVKLKEKRESADLKHKPDRPPSDLAACQISPSSPPRVSAKLFSGAEEEESKRAVAVALATAAAAEAAVAAAQAAAQVVRLTGKREFYHQLKSRRRESAAIRIQSVFRGYLARKAFHALKGFVRLQALIRGQMVRRQAENAFRSMQALQRIQSQLCSRRVRIAEEKNCEQKFELPRRVEMDGNRRKRRESRRSLKERTEPNFSSRQQSTVKLERAHEYYLEHQDKRSFRKQIGSTSRVKQCHPNEDKLEWNWVDRWIDTHPYRKNLGSSSASSSELNPPSDKHIVEVKLSLDALLKEQEVRDKLNLPEFKRSARSSFRVPNPRKSIQHTMVRDDESNASSTASLPSYMVYTESAKAKVRSSSTPRQRMAASSVYKNSSLISDTSTAMLKRTHSSQQKSSGSKGHPDSDKICSSVKGHNINPDHAFSNRGHQRLC